MPLRNMFRKLVRAVGRTPKPQNSEPTNTADSSVPKSSIKAKISGFLSRLMRKKTPDPLTPVVFANPPSPTEPFPTFDPDYNPAFENPFDSDSDDDVPIILASEMAATQRRLREDRERRAGIFNPTSESMEKRMELKEAGIDVRDFQEEVDAVAAAST